LQPIIVATAAMVGVLGLRGLGVNRLVGVLEGLALVVAYGLATTLLQPYGTRGIVLTAVAAFVLAGVGLAAARNALHAAVVADADTGTDATVELGAGEHRLHGGMVAAIIAVIMLVAALISSVMVLHGPNTHPKHPRHRHDKLFSQAAVAGQQGETRLGSVSLVSNTATLAVGTTATAINLYNSVSITPASGWSVVNQDDHFVLLGNSNRNVLVAALADASDEPDINQESSALINQTIKGAAMTDVEQDPPKLKTIQGNNFQQMLGVAYTGAIQTNQGAVEVEGLWVTLYNSATGTTGFVNIYSPSTTALDAATDEVASMIQSMW
jgi:hypothetical protein